MTIDDKGLKPCPHCGERNELYPAYRLDKDGKCIEPPYAIDCLGCGSDFTPREGVDAREAWNRRPSPALPADDAGLVAALREIYETDDHARGCEGRTYNCTCGFDDRTFATAKRAAEALSRREWQPIETAPTNRAILIHIPSRDYYGNGGVYAGMLVDMGSGRRWMTFGWAIGRDLDPGDKPSAWCEFPTPPAASQPAGGEGE